MPTDAAARCAALAGAMSAASVDAVVVATEPNFTYLSGYVTPSWAMRARPLFLVVPPSGPSTAILGHAEAARLAEIASDLATAPFSEPSSARLGDETILDFVPAAVDRLVEVLRDLGARSVAIERAAPFGPGLAEAALEALRAELGVELVDAGPLLWPLRRRKDSAELDAMRASSAALAGAYDRFAEHARPGMTERELQAVLTAGAAESGADRLGYAIVVAGAHRPLLGPPSTRRWDPEDLLLVDAGVVRDGYWADFSRHFAGAEPPAAALAGYARIVDALAAGRAACVPGARATDIAAAISSELPVDRDGAFGRVGHGIGLEITEPPSLHGAETTELAPGTTICLEPAAWFDGVGHLVGEEIVAITDDGYELLSPPFPTTLQVLA